MTPAVLLSLAVLSDRCPRLLGPPSSHPDDLAHSSLTGWSLLVAMPDSDETWRPIRHDTFTVTDMREPLLLEELISAVSGYPTGMLVTYGGSDDVLPLLELRAVAHARPVPDFVRDPAVGPEHLDIREAVYRSGSPPGLAAAARVLNTPTIKVPQGPAATALLQHQSRLQLLMAYRLLASRRALGEAELNASEKLIVEAAQQ